LGDGLFGRNPLYSQGFIRFYSFYVGIQVRYELDLRERTIRVEEELQHQRELMLAGFAQMEKRFEQVDKRLEQMLTDMNKRFEQVDKQLEKKNQAIMDILIVP